MLFMSPKLEKNCVWSESVNTFLTFPCVHLLSVARQKEKISVADLLLDETSRNSLCLFFEHFSLCLFFHSLLLYV